MLVISLGALLVLGGVLFMAEQTIFGGRLSGRFRRSSSPPGTLEPRERGGGFGLAMAADFRVASPEARFAANFARLGFHHGFGLTVTLPLVAGHQTALDLLYTGRRVDGDEALQLGIADRLVANDELRAAAIDLAADIAGSAPLAVRSIRQTMRGDLAGRVRDALARERSEQDRLSATQDWREGVAAMAERRTPEFTGT